MSILTDKQIQAQVSSIRRRLANGALHFAIRSPGEWTGPERLVIDGAEHLVVSCVSDLQAREALWRAERENMPAVLLCSMPVETLGDDVIDRLAKHRVFAPQMREIVAELFSVKPGRIDPRVLKTKVLMHALLEHVPAGGYPPVPGGTLDLQTAWLALLGRLLGEPVDSPSLTNLLGWSLSETTLHRLAGMETGLKEAFADWFAQSRGEAVRFMMAAVESGFGGDLVPLGSALGLVFDPRHSRDAEHQAARGRLERYFQHRKIDPDSARAWSRAADAVLTGTKGEQAAANRRPLLNRLDELIAELGLEDSARASDHSPMGLEQRYRHLGQALRKAPGAKSAAKLEEVRRGVAMVRRHLLGESDPERIDRIEMACRLVLWLRTTGATPPGEDFGGMVAAYHREGGFVDWARNRLKETDESPEVQKAYDAILKRVDERTRAFARDFALQLRDWTPGGRRPGRFVPVEDVLKEVVAPVAKRQPVLLLVLDGMSVAVFRQLLHDILQHDWTEIAAEDPPLPRPVLATLPSVTAISRRALFLGRLDPATNGTEEGEFKKNDLLFQGTGSQTRPRLFKMGDLSEESHGGIAEPVRKAVADKKCRVVSVVLNAIDDHLDSGKQVDFTWTRNRIRGLRDLFRHAAEAGRLVVMTSDHGHVLDCGTKRLPSPEDERGDRFRAPGGKVEDGEMEFGGPRVRKATGGSRVVLAWDEKVRYGKDKRGYHGGANPQELVVPLAILSDVRTKVPEGWREVASFQPAWWRLDASGAAPAASGKAKVAKEVEGLELFERAEPATEPATEPSTGPEAAGWIGALLASAIYKEQSKLAVRGAPDNKLMTKLLAGLDARGGTAVKQALSQDLGMPPIRVDGLVQNVSRILNVDGYEVIGFDRASDTVTLNAELLRTQFDLKESS